MIGPQVFAGMKQPYDFAAVAADGRDVTAFSAVTKNARVSQVLDSRKAAVLAADDMVDLKPEGDIVLVDQAVFATMVRAAGDFVAKRLGNIIVHWQESGAPVLWPSSGCVLTPRSGRVQLFLPEKVAALSRAE